MPPGPFTPHEHLPLGYVPTVDDGYMVVFPPSPQADDPITRQEGAPFTLQGRITDEAGNLLSGICVRVDHPAFGQTVTGPDGIFRFVVDPVPDIAASGVAWEMWACVPGGHPDWVSTRTHLTTATPGDTSTWFFRLLPASRLEATSVDRATGQPVPGVCVSAPSARSLQPALISAPSGPDGHVTLHGVAPWDSRVSAPPVTTAPCGGSRWSTWTAILPFRPGSMVHHLIELDAG